MCPGGLIRHGCSNAQGPWSAPSGTGGARRRLTSFTPLNHGPSPTLTQRQSPVAVHYPLRPSRVARRGVAVSKGLRSVSTGRSAAAGAAPLGWQHAVHTSCAGMCGQRQTGCPNPPPCWRCGCQHVRLHLLNPEPCSSLHAAGAMCRIYEGADKEHAKSKTPIPDGCTWGATPCCHAGKLGLGCRRCTRSRFWRPACRPQAFKRGRPRALASDGRACHHARRVRARRVWVPRP